MADTVKKETTAPQDKGFSCLGLNIKLNYVIFYWLGIGTLLPWNMFITVAAYWSYKFRTIEDTTDDDLVPTDLAPLACSMNTTGNGTAPQENKLQTAWGGYLAAASMIPNVTFLLLNAAFGHLFKTQPRLIISLVLVILSFIFTSIMVYVDTDGWQNTFLTITLASVVFININAAIFQGGILGIAGRFPPEYMGAVFGGQAIGGIFASGTNVVVLALGAAPIDAAFFCFIISVVFLITAFVAYAICSRTEFYKHYSGEGLPSDGEKSPEDSKLLSDTPEHKIKGGKVNPLATLGKIWPYAVSVLLCFLVTLGCFPAITMHVRSTTCSSWTEIFFVPIACFLLFNIGDYLGRFLAGLIQWPRPGKLGAYLCLIFSILRFSFIVLFIFCNVKPTGRSLTSVQFESDAAYIIIMLLMSISNGYLGSMCMISAPQLSSSGEEAQTASSLMVALLGLGLGMGAFLSNFFVKLL
jgi:equilibrative nucleoside transporter 1/2/3